METFSCSGINYLYTCWFMNCFVDSKTSDDDEIQKPCVIIPSDGFIRERLLESGLVLDLTVGISLFTMYSKCGSLEESFSLFQEIPVKDNACWASMISGDNEYGYLKEAIRLFGEMLSDGTSPDESTLSAVLTVCAFLPFLKPLLSRTHHL